jgi:hypothetical protein
MKPVSCEYLRALDNFLSSRIISSLSTVRIMKPSIDADLVFPCKLNGTIKFYLLD